MDSIDETRVYNTNAIITRCGRAVAVDVNDASLPGDFKNKHVTVLFRKMRWSDEEIAAIAKETDNWIKGQYGDHKAPVLFTITPWQGTRTAVVIHGDLQALCMHLRSVFGNLCPPQEHQRPPHAQLFRKGGRRNHKQAPNPAKQEKQRQKIAGRLQRMIGNIDELRQRKIEEINSLNEQQEQLKALLNVVGETDPTALRLEIKNIVQAAKRNGKELQHGRRMKKRERKQERNRLKKQRQEEKRLAKQQRKRMKQEKLAKLEAARLEQLPAHKSDIGDVDTLYVHVDGYNIIGCDSLCRRGMRGRNARKARERVAMLLQTQFMGRIGQFSFDYAQIRVTLWFDGNGKSEKYGDVAVEYSGAKEVVDDRLVRMFAGRSKQENACVLVVTSDRELTLRLHDIGVKVMKSGRFYKTYLGGNDKTDAAMDGTDMVHVQDTMDIDEGEEQKMSMVTDEAEDDDTLSQVIEGKVSAFLENELGEETPTDEDVSEGEDDDDTPDLGDDDDDDEDAAIFCEDDTVTVD